MIIKFKRLSETAITPCKANHNDAGFDLFADEDVTLAYGETNAIATNIALELPDGFMADVRPRSGLTRDTALRVQYGTVDAGYRGGIGIICENASYNEDLAYIELLNEMEKSDCTQFLRAFDEVKKQRIVMEYEIKKGDKIAQLVIQRIPDIELVEADVLTDSRRGEKGFGSTGK